MKSRLRTTLALLFFFSAELFAQNGSIQGVVMDAAGASIPNAKVTATDQDKQLIIREVITAPDGLFALRPLPPGRYTVRVEASGFKALERTDLVLDANQIMAIGSLSMTIGQTTESVTVEAEVPLVETETAQRGFTVTSRQVTQLPLNGRDFTSLIRTLPGVVTNYNSDFRLAFNNTDQFNVNGLRGSMNNVYLDGSINTDVGANDGQYTQISLDAVGEFRVQTSTFNAEYGRNPGVMIGITTKSGSSSYHGTAYDFLRNNYFDARNPLDTTGKVPKLRYNQFGGNLGGPVEFLPGISTHSNKKVFFFVNYEGTRASRPASTATFVDIPAQPLLEGNLSGLYRPGFILDANNQPTQFQNGQVFRPGTVVRAPGGRIIGGDPYVGNIIPKSDWARNTQGFVNILNQANRAIASPVGASNPELVRMPFVPTYKFDKNAWVVRADYNISSSTNFFFRWADDSQREDDNRGIFNNTPYPVFPEYRAKPGASWSYNLISVISPTITNEAIFTYNHLTQIVDVDQGFDSKNYDRTALGFTYKELYANVNPRNRFPTFNCGVGSCNFTSFNANWRSEGKTFAITDNLTFIRGAHTFKTGVLWNRNHNGQQPTWTDTLNFNFGTSPDNLNDTGNQFANMLLGNYTTVAQSNGIFFGQFRFNSFEAFVQDSWKVNKNLTLEYGIRWAYLGPTYTVDPFLQYYFDPRKFDQSKAAVIATTNTPTQKIGSIIGGDPFNGMVQEGSGIPKGFIDHRFNNWGPRFGFSYDPFGDGKTAIRGGGGIFYERIRQNNLNFDALRNAPLTYTPTIYSGNIDNVDPSLIASGVRFPTTAITADSKGQLPTIYSWSFGIQRELPGNTSIDVAYVGNRGKHLMYQRNLNLLPVGTTVNNPNLLPSVNSQTNALRPYRGYDTVNFVEFGASSRYDGLQTRITRRFAKNFTANASYVWSKALGDTDNDTTTIGDPYNRRREWSPLGFDRTHAFSADWVYDLPRFGNDANGVVKAVFNGWQLNGIMRIWSGTPITVTSNGNPGNLAAPNTGVRADYVTGQNVTSRNDSTRQYLNPFAFARPVEGTLGNVGKNSIRLPGINSWDMSLYKTTRITERVSTQLRWETFNTFNHTQWATVNTGINVPNPSTAVTDATRGTFGQVNATRDPRTMQLALKVLF